MSKIDDEEDGIKQFFSNVSHRYDINYDEGDWKKMEKMLDAEEARVASIRSAQWKVATAIGVSLLVILPMLYFFIYPELPGANSSSSSKAKREESIEQTDLKKEPVVTVERSIKNLGVAQESNGNAQNSTSSPIKEFDEPTKEINSSSLATNNDDRKNTSSPSIDKNALQKKRMLQSKNESITRKNNTLELSLLKNKKQKEVILESQENTNEFTSTQVQPYKKSEEQPASEQRKSIEKENTDLPARMVAQDDAKATAIDQSGDFTTVVNDSRQGHLKKEDSTSAISLSTNKEKIVTVYRVDAYGKVKLRAQGNTRVPSSAEGKEMQYPARNTPQSSDKIDTVIRSMALKPKLIRDTTHVIQVMENEPKIERKEADTITIDKKDSVRVYSRWSITLAAAPDFTSSKVFEQASAGSAFGLTFQYSLSKRFALQTGALLTTKKYWNSGSEYNDLNGYWKARTNGILPERIDGKCNVVEIPLSVRYTLMSNMKSNVQASLGMSSYIMFREHYSYDFEHPNPTAAQSWESSETNYYMMSIGSVSMAYERLIHRNLSLGVEPYAKIPFTKLGWPNLPLYTMGVYITLRYRILKSR